MGKWQWVIWRPEEPGPSQTHTVHWALMGRDYMEQHDDGITLTSAHIIGPEWLGASGSGAGGTGASGGLGAGSTI